ncbi:MAG TPA: septal ring lytic transglycosylase RlpA family protein [Chitinophagaceae bacterium]|nr:septal ring lytic transglycosylase RlpA family protein [Chitinophagaceae bacterium]
MKFRFWIPAFLILFTVLLADKEVSFSQWQNDTIPSWNGVASYYHSKFNGRKTSTGERFSNALFTCANNFLALGSYIRVTNLRNGKAVIVKVNDRMHPKNKRLVDLSQAAARELGFYKEGLGQVCIEPVQFPEENIAVN